MVVFNLGGEVPQIVNLSEENGELFASTEAGQLRVWNKEKWIGKCAASNDFDPAQKIIGPVLLKDSKQVVFAKSGRGGRGSAARGNLTIIDSRKAPTKRPKEKAKNRDYRWDSENGPRGTGWKQTSLARKGTMLVLAEPGIFRLDPKKLELSESVPTSIWAFRFPSCNGFSV